VKDEKRGGARRHARRGRKAIGLLAVYLCAAALTALGWLYTSLPERIYVEAGDEVRLTRFSWLQPMAQYGAQNVASTRAVGSYTVTMGIGGLIPIKTIRTVVTERPTVTVCGTPFGVKMFSEGALIVGFTDISLENGGHANPAKTAGLRLGDRVICIDNVQTLNNDAVKEALEQSNGAPVEVVYVRDGEQYSTQLTPVKSAEDGQWMAGMWVRDSSAGVGTLTFVDEEAGVFAGLGHAISDSDTGESVALRSGEIVPCTIVGYTAGTAGSPGELKGQFVSAHAIGTIRLNGDNGVYGTTRTNFEGQSMEVAFAQEVETGAAEIWTTISGEEPQAYSVKIERISDADALRNLVIRVTDERLLKETGGIVQGMSGSPIVQNGRLVGAVTHVLVNDPTRGYGIFAETMLEQAEQVAAENAA
jgi:stage IV sporulation protein B